MPVQPQTPVTRTKERIFMLLIAAVLVVLFVGLFGVLQENFADVGPRLKDGTMVNLNGRNPARNLAAMLQKGYYFEDGKDISLIERVVSAQMPVGQKFDNIGELNKKRFNVSTDEAFAEG